MGSGVRSVAARHRGRLVRAARRRQAQLRARILVPIETVPGDAIYLTFDDGPDPHFTPQVLDLLDRRGHRATFFVLGVNANNEPQLVRDLRRRGHAVGSHSQSHPKGWENKTLVVLRDYLRGHRAVCRAAGEPVRLFRPPYGHDDSAAWWTAVLTRSRWIHWTIDSFDWEPTATAEGVLERIGAPVPGSIVLLHDHLYDNLDARDRSATVAALELLLDRLDAVGLRSEALR